MSKARLLSILLISIGIVAAGLWVLTRSQQSKDAITRRLEVDGYTLEFDLPPTNLVTEGERAEKAQPSVAGIARADVLIDGVMADVSFTVRPSRVSERDANEFARRYKTAVLSPRVQLTLFGRRATAVTKRVGPIVMRSYRVEVRNGRVFAIGIGYLGGKSEAAFVTPQFTTKLDEAVARMRLVTP